MPQDKQRPGFMVYFCDWDMPRRILDAVNFKEFFDAVFNYAQNGEIPPSFSCSTVQVFFDSFMEKINADNERYQETCRKRSIAAKKSHEAKTSNSMQMQQMQANAANTNTNPNTNNNINTNNNNRINSNNNPNSDYNNSNDTNMNIDYQNASMQMQSPYDDDDLPF